MEKLVYDYPAGGSAARRVLVGVVGSGDLEVLLAPNAPGTTSIVIHTSVHGMAKVWKALLTRIFTTTLLPAAKIEINDCGATPGVVRMRLEQAFEALHEPDRK
ncbi:malonate decarboxylase subunit delta [Duganella sp. BJB488]|uniref:malonate decarboxylase subunit delta n=1 Tax=unclassified Duganella TaxID=2636909 RepID=UPI000E348F8A|nr:MULTISPECIES: malonate decarboxylase subunit delta [unclassified Duganella]RFP13257.1 malonate decarboxylase subunit delta [Duganella sp. BJB489]RFP17167.1 malonate decarboxylase subunit delta [Duganella sp. BJB488]RFP31612.1 malonate decarboxylase subunit delta [Duganella sp. BJB480]